MIVKVENLRESGRDFVAMSSRLLKKVLKEQEYDQL